MTQDYNAALNYVTALTGSPDTIMQWRGIHDTDRSQKGFNRAGSLAQVWNELVQWQTEGRGIFVIINQTDGIGREAQNVTAVRAHYVDLDDVMQSGARYNQAMEWALKPHFSVWSSPNKYHIYWLVSPYVPGDFFSTIQRKLIKTFDSDKTIWDAPRVLRVPGFYHLKDPANPHMIQFYAGTGWGAAPHTAEQFQAMLAGVVDAGGGTGDNSGLGDPKLAAPSLEWLKHAMEKLDPNTMDRAEWIKTTAAFKQAGWAFGEAVIKPIWDEWCEQYTGDPTAIPPKPGNNPGENNKQWNSIGTTRAGWPSLLKASGLLAQQMFGNGPGQMPAPVTPGPGAPPIPQDGGAPPMPGGSPLSPNQLGTMLTPAEQAIYFAGCYLIEKDGKILTPRGRFMDAGRFNAKYGGKQFIIKADGGGGSTTDEAWKAATRGQIYQVPKVDHIRFLPSETPGAIIEDELGRKGVNTYIPANISYVDSGVGGELALPFVNHLRKILPTEQDVLILLNYFARIVQSPGVKIPWAPVIQSAEGVGKNVIKFCMTHAVGKVYTYYPKAAELAETGGKFNAWMRNRLFILCDEVKTDDKRNLIEALKDMVSEEVIEIQGKGVDQDIEDNFGNWCFFTNWEDAIPIDRKSRRWAIFFSKLQTEDDILNAGMDAAYFSSLYNWIRHGNGKQIVAHYLKHFAIDPALDPAINQRAPKTSSYDAAIVASRTAPEQAIVSAIEHGRPGFKNGWVSSAAVQTVIKENELKVSHMAIGRILKFMGYTMIGRAARTWYQEDNKQPNLWALSPDAQVNQYGRDQGYE